MPSKEAAQLQQSREFVEKEDAAVMRKAPVAKGDFHISRRTTHSDLNVTKNDVKVRTENRRKSPAKSGQKSRSLRVFTPDSGTTESRGWRGMQWRPHQSFSIRSTTTAFSGCLWPR